MCKNKNLQKKMVNLFEEKVAKIPTSFAFDDVDEYEKAQYPIPAVEREVFKKVLQAEYPDLRYRNIEGLITIDDFAVKVENELKKKEEFFSKALAIIRNVAGHPEYTLDSFLFEEFEPRYLTGNKKLSDQANYFVHCQKVYNALALKMYTKVVFRPSAPALEKVHNLRELIDLYYRKGRF